MSPRAYLTDFGLAKAPGGAGRAGLSPEKLTRTGTVLGTPAYMSPEQARGEATGEAGHVGRSPASDVWSLGCVLYEALAGRPAFEGENDAAVVARVLLREPIPLGRVGSAIPRGLDTVVRACLAKRPGRRLQNGAALREDLERVRRGERPRARPPGRWRRTATVAAIAAAVGAALVTVAWSTRARPDDAPVADAVSEGERLAARARELRSADPRRAEALLRSAIELVPGRDGWQLERGLLLWAIGEGAAARRSWDAIPPETPEAAAGRLYGALEACFRWEEGGLRWGQAAPEMRGLAAGSGRESRLADAALATIERRWAGAREGLRGVPGWEAALLRALVEHLDPRGDRNVAIQEYTRGLDEGIQFAWALNNRGNARMDLGDVAGAIEDYDAALALDPRMAEAWTNRGTARSAQRDFAGAFADCARAIEVNPSYAHAWYSRGNVRRDQADLAGAIADYGKALEIDPRYAEAWSNRGMLRRARGDLTGAVEDFSEALAVNPRLTEAWNNRGVARMDLGDLAGAIEDLGKALDANPRYATAWDNRGLARRARGELAEALEDFGKAVEADPGLAMAWRHRADARRAQGDLAGAIQDYGRALETDPRHADAWNNRGVVREAQGDLPGAIADFAQALAVAAPGWPSRALVERNLARVRAALAARGGR